MVFRLATLPTWQNVSQIRPKIKENSETDYIFSERLEGKGILVAPPRQLLIKCP